VTPETFENVFAPLVKKKFLNVEQILLGMRIGAIMYEKLPLAARETVDEEINRRRKDQMTRSMMLVLLLGTMGEVRYKTRLQKYLFLADRQFARQKGRKPRNLVYDWEPHKFGPFSSVLDLCIRDAVQNKMIEVFTVKEDSRDGVGYRLSVKGRSKFKTMLQTLESTSGLIHEMLYKFQNDSTEYQLLEFVYQMHPEYATESQIHGRPDA